MLQHLHEAGVEIVSPTFMNQRQLEPTHQFIPPPQPRTVEEAATPPVEETVNPKRQKARSIEALREERDGLVTEADALRAQLRDTGPDQGGNEAADRLRLLEQKIERLESQIEAGEQEKAEA